MKKLLLMFFVTIGAINGVFAVNNGGQTADELAIDNCIDFLHLDPDKEKTFDAKHWLLIKQLFSLDYLTNKTNSDKKMSLEKKQEAIAKLNGMGDIVRQQLNELRELDAFVGETLREQDSFVEEPRNKINEININKINAHNVSFIVKSKKLLDMDIPSIKIKKLIRKDKMNRE